jgi:hypothetical protein
VLLAAAVSLAAAVPLGLANDGASSEVAAAGSPGPKFTIDFAGYAGGSVEQWLEARNFKFEKDAKNRRLLGLAINGQSLDLSANGRLTGFIVNDSINLSHVTRVRIKWGIRQYPQETSYEKNLNNEALMIYFFFGTEKVSSGHLLIPDSPYFIGLFLCHEEQVNFPYKGRYFHAGGRFVCLGKPPVGEMVESEFNLDSGFKNYFGKQQTPGITGIALGVDTSRASGNGRAAAFLKSIEFFE